MVIVNWKTGLKSMQSWGKIGNSWGIGNMILGDVRLGSSVEFFGVYQRRRGRKSQIIVRCYYQIPPDPKTPAQLSSRYYMGDINKTFHNLSNDQLNTLFVEGNKKALNRFQIYARYMQLERPSYLGVMHLGFSYLGDLKVF